MANPEIEFRTRFVPDYSGMELEEIPFCQMQDHYGHQQTYKLDLITPPQPAAQPRPCVLFIHGGGFTQPCDKRQAYISLFARALTREGYAVAAPDYPVFEDEAQRDAGGGEAAGARKAGEAVHLAYRYLQENAEPLGIAPERIALMSGSAGGMSGFYAISDYPQDGYRSFVNLWGAPAPLPPLDRFPPVLSVHGNQDLLVAYEREAPIQQELSRLGIRHELITLEGAGHTPLAQMDLFLPKILELLRQTL